MMDEIRNKIPSHLLREDAQGTGPKNEMGKNEFMKLLVTQLQNQDPLKPMEHTEFITQLAQFSTLEQLSNIDTGIKGLKDGTGDETKLQALGMIGKHVDAMGNSIDFEEGKSLVVPFAFDGEAKAVRASIYDLNGNMVRAIDLTSNVGTNEFRWDGKNEEGEGVASGKYTFRVVGLGADGRVQEVGSDVKGKVVGVVVEGTVPTLVVETKAGKLKVELSKVRSFNEEETKPAVVPRMELPQAPSAPIVAEGSESDEGMWEPKSMAFEKVMDPGGRFER